MAADSDAQSAARTAAGMAALLVEAMAVLTAAYLVDYLVRSMGRSSVEMMGSWWALQMVALTAVYLAESWDCGSAVLLEVSMVAWKVAL